MKKKELMGYEITVKILYTLLKNNVIKRVMLCVENKNFIQKNDDNVLICFTDKNKLLSFYIYLKNNHKEIELFF